ncbi:putative transcription factor bZIP family [Lupinus albus]|uniref:Putative transcription factor bZIP family n=1 Tax=Lupinus albus TaxID=3870 RepID=A0A6A4PPY5_LUPAL|nr:putative transcription factor bZIP family [Lupinus albus]
MFIISFSETIITVIVIVTVTGRNHNLCTNLMAPSTTGNSSTCTKFQSSGSEEDLKVLMDQRKNKRKVSNRESARRCRMRKQNHIDDMMNQVSQLTKDKSEILTSVNITTQHYLNVEAENSILRAQIIELNQRFESLNGIINLINTSTTNGNGAYERDCYLTSDENFMNPINMLYLNEPTHYGF